MISDAHVPTERQFLWMKIDERRQISRTACATREGLASTGRPGTASLRDTRAIAAGFTVVVRGRSRQASREGLDKLFQAVQHPKPKCSFSEGRLASTSPVCSRWMPVISTRYHPKSPASASPQTNDYCGDRIADLPCRCPHLRGQTPHRR